MDREQTKQLFKLIVSVYPNFSVDTSKLDTWTGLLNNQDFNRVMLKAQKHARESKFPPTVADLYERKTEAHSNDFLKLLDQWEKDAKHDKRRR